MARTHAIDRVASPDALCATSCSISNEIENGIALENTALENTLGSMMLFCSAFVLGRFCFFFVGGWFCCSRIAKIGNGNATTSHCFEQRAPFHTGS